jgi:hypothetical protein
MISRQHAAGTPLGPEPRERCNHRRLRAAWRLPVPRERTNPESELIALVERLVDNVLARRRHRPTPPIRAMSKRQCATATNLGISTIEAAIREGDLPASKVKTRTIVLVDDFERWLAGRPRIKPQIDAGAEPGDDRLIERDRNRDVFDGVSAPKVAEARRRPAHADV